jgi:hypothetical protein
LAEEPISGCCNLRWLVHFEKENVALLRSARKINTAGIVA